MYVAGVFEILSAEMLEVAGNASRENKKKQHWVAISRPPRTILQVLDSKKHVLQG